MSKFNAKTPWFMFKKHRFQVDNHPVVTTNESKWCQYAIKLDANELQQLQGLAKMFGKDTVTAVRIALYETQGYDGPIDTHKAVKPVLRGTQRHLRNRTVKLRVTTAEHNLITALAEKWGVKKSVVLRICILELNSSIRSEQVKKLTKSKKISQKDLQKEWAAENKDRPKGSTVQYLKDAAARARDKAIEEAQDHYDLVGSYADILRYEGTLYAIAGDADTQKVDMHQVEYLMLQEMGYEGQQEHEAKIKDGDEVALAKHLALEIDGHTSSWKDYLEEAQTEIQEKRGEELFSQRWEELEEQGLSDEQILSQLEKEGH